MRLIEKGYDRALEDTPRQTGVVYVFCRFYKEGVPWTSRNTRYTS